MAKPSPRKRLIKECDDLWAQIVKARDGKCQICGRDGCLQSHHIMVRQYLATRHDPSNGVALCRGCHYRGHMEPEKFRDQMIEIIGEAKFNQLKEKSRFYGKPFKITVKDLEDRREWLKTDWARRTG